MRTINELSAKRSTGHDSISTELLKRIKSSIPSPLCLIVNQFINTGIFPGKLKQLQRLYHCTKKEIKLSSVITDKIPYFRLSLKYLKKLYIYTIILLKSVCRCSKTAGRNSCSIVSGDVSNWHLYAKTTQSVCVGGVYARVRAGCVRTRVRAFVRVCVCARVCVRACVMCLQYTILIFNPG